MAEPAPARYSAQVMVRGGIVGLVAVLSTGCSFDALGTGESNVSGGSSDSGSSGGSTSSGASTSDGTSQGSATSDSATSQGTSASTTANTSNTTTSAGTETGETSDGSTSAAADGPRLSISDGPTYDFGIVDVPMTGSHDFTVSSVGDEAATSIAVQALAGPFAIVTDDCPASLQPGQECTITVELSPTEFGAVSETLAVDYGPGAATASVDLDGAGGGTSENLVANPGGENNSNPPVGWTEQLGTTWYTPAFGSQLPAHGGSRVIYPGNIAPMVFAELSQDIDLTPYATALGQGALRVDFSGWGISGFPDQDNYRYTIEFRNGGGVIGMPLLDTDWQLGNSWQQYTAGGNAPTNATAVRVRLRCELIGGSICDGGFDDIRVRVSYVP